MKNKILINNLNLIYVDTTLSNHNLQIQKLKYKDGTFKITDTLPDLDIEDIITNKFLKKGINIIFIFGEKVIPKSYNTKEEFINLSNKLSKDSELLWSNDSYENKVSFCRKSETFNNNELNLIFNKKIKIYDYLVESTPSKNIETFITEYARKNFTTDTIKHNQNFQVYLLSKIYRKILTPTILFYLLFTFIGYIYYKNINQKYNEVLKVYNLKQKQIANETSKKKELLSLQQEIEKNKINLSVAFIFDKIAQLLPNGKIRLTELEIFPLKDKSSINKKFVTCKYISIKGEAKETESITLFINNIRNCSNFNNAKVSKLDKNKISNNFTFHLKIKVNYEL